MTIFNSLLMAIRAHGPRPKWARKSQRFAVSAPALVRVSDTVGANWEKVTLADLSLGGARVWTSSRARPKTTVDLKMSLDGTDIAVRAVVVYASRNTKSFQGDCGLRFVDLSYEQYRALIAYVNRREDALKTGVSHPRRSQLA